MAQQHVVGKARVKRPRWLSGAAIVLPALVVCGLMGWVHSRLNTRGAASSSPVIVFHASDAQFAAILQGPVLTLHHGWLFLGGRPIAWPAGSNWHAATKVITVPTNAGGTRRIQTGQALPAVGGGEIPLESLRDIDSVYAALSRCARYADPGSDVFIVSAAR